jgi:general secretion pathway protein E
MICTDTRAACKRRTIVLTVLAALFLGSLSAGLSAAEPPAAPAAAAAAQPAAAAAQPAAGAQPAAAQAAPAASAPAAKAQSPGVQLYISPWWLGLVILSIMVWLYATSWACSDARGNSIDYPVVTTMMLGVGWAALVLVTLIHAAVSFLLLIAVVAGVVVYIRKRNRVVPEQQKLFGPAHLKRLFGNVPVLKNMITVRAGKGEYHVAIPLVNMRGRYLTAMLDEQPPMAEAGSIFADLVVRGCTSQARKVRFAFAKDKYVAQFHLDGVTHSAETFDADLGQKVLVCASLFLGLTAEGRPRQGSSKITAEMAGGDKVEVDAEIVAVEGKAALVLDFPNWTANLHKKGLEVLGVHPAVIKRLQAAATQTKGAIIVCGPPGCGKTTTLYGVAGLIDIFTTDVIAVEKKPEYELVSIRRWALAGDKPISQTFAELMREGPQAIMWGEMDGAEQASNLLQFADETGLVLTTMKAGDAAAALLTLAKLTGDGKLVGRSVSCVISQRLVRRLCTNCREQVEPNPALVSKLKLDPAQPGQWFRPVGCPACLNSGFRGQIGLFEMLIITEPVSKAIAAEGTTATAIRHSAGEGALRSMYQDGLTKVTAGITTLEEIGRVLKQTSGKPKKAGES